MAAVERIERAGWEVVRVSTDQVVLEVVPGLGGSVLSFRRRSDDAEVLATPPWGLLPPQAAPLPGDAPASWLERSPGGWATVFPTGAGSTTVAGADWPAGGEARLSWFDWRTSGSSLVLDARMRRSPFELTKIISVHRDTVTLGETVRHVGADPADVVWGQQLRLGADLLGPGTVLDTGATLVRTEPRAGLSAGWDDLLPWPRAYGPDGLVNLRGVPPAGSGETRTAYLSELRSPTATVRNPARELTVELEWDATAWPHLWCDVESGGRPDHPWYGASHVVTLTPASSWPDAGVPEVRRTSATSLRIHPGGVRTAHLSARLH